MRLPVGLAMEYREKAIKRWNQAHGSEGSKA